MSRTRKFPTVEKARDRRNLGAVYTPLWMARYIVDRSLVSARDSKIESSRIVDPACGDGVFLQATFERLLLGHEQSQAEPLRFDQRLSLFQKHVFGVDLDEQAVESARLRLAQLILRLDSSKAIQKDSDVERVAQSLSENIVHGNALLAAEDVALHGEPCAVDWRTRFPQASGAGGFDAVVGNPPYVNIRRINQTYGEPARDYLKANFKTATGNFDLYVLFIELANRLLRPGGTAGLIVPNKLGTLKYATACREMLLRESEILQIGDVSQADVFRGTGVYPYIVIWRNEKPDSCHEIEVVEASSQRELTTATPRKITQSGLESESGFAIHGELDVESRVASKPLGELCQLHSGTTGFASQKIAAALVELNGYTDDAFPFVVSGNIDRYRIELGQVRYMKRKFVNPGLPHRCSDYSENKRRLYSNAKIVIAGLTKEIEAAWDDGGLALGVQVYAATDFSIDHWYVLAVLNSRLMTDLFRLRFNAKHLSGGYLAINKGQLELLPIAVAGSDREADLIDEIGLLGRKQHQNPCEEIDSQINRLVNRLYDVKNCTARVA